MQQPFARLISRLAAADELPRFPRDASFTTLIITPLAIEGLTGDTAGNLYTTGRAAGVVWKLTADGSGGFTSPGLPLPVH